MDVSAQTLREVEFREKLRGYHPDDVDEFLERVAAGIEYLQDRMRQAIERAQRAESKAAESTEGDDALKRTLVLAQRTAEMAVQEARQEADRIASSARAEANAIVAQAEDMARRTIEETQGGIRSELAQLETARDRLRADISALEHHLDQERSRLRDSLSQALQAVEHHLAPAPPAPEADGVAVPPLRIPKVGPLPEPDAETIAAFASPESVIELPDIPEPAEPEPFEIEIVHTVAEGTLAEPPAREAPAPVAAVAEPEAAAERDDEVEEGLAISGPLFDELADGAVPAGGFGRPAAPTSAAPEPEAAAEAEVEEDDDPFITELRRAITDTQPLGPRDEGDMPSGTHDDDLMHSDVLDSSRLGSLLRRRR
ncbi:MAG: cell division initiation protein [Actinomycetota bacterium]|jgi:cell division initiation protein